MSADLVPGCIRRLAFASMILCSMVGSWVVALPSDGDLGPIWISVGGGGLGKPRRAWREGHVCCGCNTSSSIANVQQTPASCKVWRLRREMDRKRL
jgi:hypothetical protein